MNSISIATFLTVCALILQKVFKFLKNRKSDCGLDTPCFKLYFDIEEPEHRHGHEDDEHEDRHEDEHKQSYLQDGVHLETEENKDDDADSNTSLSSLPSFSSLEPNNDDDGLDFKTLEQTLHILVSD